MEQQAVNLVDLGVAAIVLVSAIFAFYRGFVRELLSIAGWVGAAVVAVYFFDDLRPYVEPYLPTDWMVAAATGAALFLGALIVFSLVIHFVVVTVKDSPLNALDRSLGFLFGVARGVVVMALAYMVAEMVVFKDDEQPRPEWLTEARSLPLINYAAGMIVALIPEGTFNLPIEGFDEIQELRARRDAQGGDAAQSDEDARRMAEPPVAAPEAADPDQETAYDDADSEDLDILIESLDEEVAPIENAPPPADETASQNPADRE